MQPIDSNSSVRSLSRRSFVRQTLATSALAGFSILSAKGQGIPKDQMIKVGLIGCGGRGTGAASQALTADPYTKLIAVGDVFESSINNSLNSLKSTFAERADVPASHRFVGLDSYQKVLDSGVDVVLLATPPGFRPLHFAAAVEAGKHIFAEKPVAVDAPGVRMVIEAAKKAKEKNLTIVNGFCWRYSTSRRAIFERILGGEIGDVKSILATFHTGPVKPMPKASDRKAEWSDVEWQIRNWYNFSWLSGDGLVEQAVHSVDKIAWAFRDEAPKAAIATGGRAIQAEGGNIFDHFHVAYEYQGGRFGHLASRQIPGCYNENSDYIVGEKGQGIIGKGPTPVILSADNKPAWRFEGSDNNMYQQEHDELFAALRKGEPINHVDTLISSTMLAIMGRMSAYTGQRVTWEDAMNSKEDLAPDSLKWGDSFTPNELPKPGVTKFS